MFYFGIAADITPPVALAAYAASAIAKSRPMATAVNATKLGIAKFVVPYIFAFSPVLLLLGDDVTAFTVILNTGTALVGVFGLQCALTSKLFGYHLNPLVRVAFAAAGLCMMIPGVGTDVVGLVAIAGLCGFQLLLARKHKSDSDDDADDSTDVPSIPAEAMA